jgi:predicted ATPase
MMARIHELARKRSQFVIATHSPILMAYPNSWIYQIVSSGGLERVSLHDTEHYVVAKHFLNDPQGQIARILDEDPNLPLL